MNIITSSGLVLVDEDDPPYLAAELGDPTMWLDSLDQVDIYILNSTGCPLIERAKELSRNLRLIAKKAKRPFEQWEKSRYTKDQNGKVLINWIDEPPPAEVREEIEELDSEYKDESRSLRTILNEIGEWRRKQKRESSKPGIAIRSSVAKFANSLENLKKKLQRLHEKIMAVGGPNTMLGKTGWAGGNEAAAELRTLLQYELLPLIEESDLLKGEYERRLLYFDRLIESREYQDLIADIHSAMIALKSFIDPEKLPAEPRLMNPKRDDPERDPWIPLRELHARLDDESKWWKLEDSNHYIGVPTERWKHVLGQYETISGLMSHAWASHALPENDECGKQLEKLNRSIGILKKKFEEPFYRLHMHDFDFFNHYARSPDMLIDSRKESIEHAKRYADVVCSDLLQFLDDCESGHTNQTEISQGTPIDQSVEENSQGRQQKVPAWTGDQPLAYQESILRIGSRNPARIPKADDGENRRVLLELLVTDYQQEGDGMGITPAVFKKKLNVPAPVLIPAL